MTTIAIDIQPQYRFSCMAANEKRFLHQPENIVDELNRQTLFADKRILIENIGATGGALCAKCIDAPLNRSGFVFNRNGARCMGNHLFAGLPCPADYDHSIETDGDYRHGACFHDSREQHSTGLMEWLYANNADTVILGGLATEEAIANTAKQLVWYDNRLNVIVNLSACCGYAPESTLAAISTMRDMGIVVVTHSAAIPSVDRDFSLYAVKVS